MYDVSALPRHRLATQLPNFNFNQQAQHKTKDTFCTKHSKLKERKIRVLPEMIKSTLIFRNDGVPLSASVDSDNDPTLLDQKKKVKLIVSRITPNSETRASIDSADYQIHYFMEQNIVYFVICEKNYPRKLAFSYLKEISQEFQNSHGVDAQRPDVRPYAYVSFDNYMQKTRKLYQDERAQSNLDKLNSELADVKSVLHKNIEDLLYRGDSLDRMSEVSSNIRMESKKYRKAARKINFDLLIKQYAPVVGLGLFFVFIIWYMFLRG